jgi:hypothetical protein
MLSRDVNSVDFDAVLAFTKSVDPIVAYEAQRAAGIRDDVLLRRALSANSRYAVQVVSTA